MRFTPTRLRDVVLIEPRVFEDARGHFLETWQARTFANSGIEATFVQDNQSASRQWVLRGLHYQLRQPQGKLVRVTQGEAFDVAVDLRRSSSTFGQWVGERLSGENRRMLWIPPGFAHGFLAMSDRVELLYKCSDFYAPADERTLLWNDEQVAIEWPLPPGVEPLMSEKDRSGMILAQADCFP
jgi:dTDP-4-dehydrorhamnose 3,5-epimerase